jgi:hypothetical protein
MQTGAIHLSIYMTSSTCPTIPCKRKQKVKIGRRRDQSFYSIPSHPIPCIPNAKSHHVTVLKKTKSLLACTFAHLPPSPTIPGKLRTRSRREWGKGNQRQQGDPIQVELDRAGESRKFAVERKNERHEKGKREKGFRQE